MIITEKIQNYTSHLFMKYTTDLKLICKHALLLFGKNEDNPSGVINRNSSIFNNIDEERDILTATIEELNKIKYMANIYNSSSKKFDYLIKYEEEFKNIYDKNIILKSLLSSKNHSELNSISYYGKAINLNDFSDKDKTSIKYLISILKTIYIRRYITKRENMDYIRFIIINTDELYIYPPDAYNITSLYNFNISYSGYTGCSYESDDLNLAFPRCIYKFIDKSLMNINEYYMTIIDEKLYYGEIYEGACLRIPFINHYETPAIICTELNLSTYFNAANFKSHEKLEYGLIAYKYGKIYHLFYNKKNLYDDLKNIYNDSYSEEFLINDNNKKLFTLFHFLYYNLTIISKEHPELNINYTEIELEYKDIYNIMIQEMQDNLKNKTNKIIFFFNKTICRKGLLINEYECVKDKFQMIIYPIMFKINKLNSDYIETQETKEENFQLYIYSIISINPFINNDKINTILKIKIKRVIILFSFFTIICLCFFFIIINFVSECSLNSINKIIFELNKINIDNDQKKYINLEEGKIVSLNKEMSQLKNIYDTMRKTIIIKQAFGIENYLNKHNIEFFKLVQDIDKINIKEICNSYLGFFHYNNNAYSLAENELKSTILFIIDNENKAMTGKNSENEDKIKDAIKRSSTVSYINEYSEFEKIEENLLTLINLKIFKQRFMYLYAMTKFKLGNEINNTSNVNTNTGVNQNKNKTKKDKDKKIRYYKEAIKYFNECRNINIVLGINQIKIIYCLIMISKCYIQLNDYSHAINNINEALSLFFEFSKSFKEYHSKNYNPRIMLFVESNIFHYILFTIASICNTFNKPFACNWITLKIFETSPFLISNVHYYSGIFLQNYLDKNKLKFNKPDSKLLKNSILLKEYEKTKKYISKIISRMHVKTTNNRNIKLKNEKMIGDASYSTSYKNKTDSKSNFSSTFKRDLVTTGKISTSIHSKNRNINKTITLCLSEKILEKVNGLELKDVIIKYFQKYFIMNENDKFSYIQFANNGKKTVYFKAEQLDYFLLKIQKTKNTFELTDSFIPNSSSPFMELYNIFDSIIKNYPSTDDVDNIIIMFINTDDIRFSSINECLNIVEELNKKNTSVFLLSYDVEIKKEKINNIQSFLNGLFEGHFFQIKSYQQLKQIFINLSVIKYQSNFFGYNFNSLDNEL